MDKRPLRVGLVFLSAALTLAALLLTGCAGSDDRAKVEASLQHYLRTPYPQGCLDSRFCQEGVFPIGAGAPQVKENSCKKIHTGPALLPEKPRPALLPEGHPHPASLPEGLSGWSCVITFRPGKTALLWPSQRRTTAKSPGRRRRLGKSRFHQQPSTREARSSHGLRRRLGPRSSRSHLAGGAGNRYLQGSRGGPGRSRTSAHGFEVRRSIR